MCSVVLWSFDEKKKSKRRTASGGEGRGGEGKGREIMKSRKKIIFYRSKQSCGVMRCNKFSIVEKYSQYLEICVELESPSMLMLFILLFSFVVFVYRP